MQGLQAGSHEAMAISQALSETDKNIGRAPTKPYFDVGTVGYRHETAVWPTKPELHGPVEAAIAGPPKMFARLCDCGWMLPSTVDVDVEVPNLKLKIVCPRCSKKWENEITKQS